MFDDLTTPHLADACLRIGVEVRCGPPRLAPVAPSMRMAGPVQPVRHNGSVDGFFEAMERAVPGAVLVIDDQARRDRACIGDLTALEARLAGLGGMVVNGSHRDTVELLEIGLPVFSLGPCPTGPLGVEPRPADPFGAVTIGDWTVTGRDFVVGDADGILFLPADQLDRITTAAIEIRDRERRQARSARDGTNLRTQFQFTEYLRRRAEQPGYSFRDHLATIGAAIEV